jgi:hypothetical protein
VEKMPSNYNKKIKPARCRPYLNTEPTASKFSISQPIIF